MFGRKKNRSERSFSIMLADELLRAELKRLYGEEVKIFQSDIEATSPASKKSPQDTTISEVEQRWFTDKTIERYVTIKVIVGPFERLYPENPPEDYRRRLRRVEAICRLFSVETGVTQWRPHFLFLAVSDDTGKALDTVYQCYEAGCGIEGEACSQTAPNPCQDMCASQTDCHYPSIYPALHGLKDKPIAQTY